MKIEQRPIGKVVPYPGNPRRLGDRAVEALADSIREFGFRQPIVVDAAGVIVVGHTRLLAAQHLGLTEVPVHVAKDLSSAQIQAYRIADNRTSELSGWDIDLLVAELRDIPEISLPSTGFTMTEVESILGTHDAYDEAQGAEGGEGSGPADGLPDSGLQPHTVLLPAANFKELVQELDEWVRERTGVE